MNTLESFTKPKNQEIANNMDLLIFLSNDTPYLPTAGKHHATFCIQFPCFGGRFLSLIKISDKKIFLQKKYRNKILFLYVSKQCIIQLCLFLNLKKWFHIFFYSTLLLRFICIVPCNLCSLIFQCYGTFYCANIPFTSPFTCPSTFELLAFCLVQPCLIYYYCF